MVHRVWEWDQSAGLADGGVVDVVISGNHPKVEWGQVNLFLHSNALEVKGGVERGNKTGCTMSSTTATKEALFQGSAKWSSSSRILYCKHRVTQWQHSSNAEVCFSPWIVPDLRVCSPQALRGGRTSGGGSYLCACGRGWGEHRWQSLWFVIFLYY